MDQMQFDSVQMPSRTELMESVKASIEEGNQFFLLYDPVHKEALARAVEMLGSAWEGEHGVVLAIRGARDAEGFWDELAPILKDAPAPVRSVAEMRAHLLDGAPIAEGRAALWIWAQAHHLRSGDLPFFREALGALCETLGRQTASRHLGVQRRRPPPLSAGLLVAYEWASPETDAGPTAEEVTRELFGDLVPGAIALLPMRIVHLRK